ncbi:hypothetical protein DC345_14690 [Paenibacillus taichungensis]|uniref:Tox-SHH domain-containing protein n=1 Tax=Paenibacillus taichungensis TaxID=484184 RepID=A0A329QS84_9BACL|nr:hypothetical protein CS562_32405 [Paenibacillus sp. LK1]RAW15260.1 hypothetical protein DC345_14690 [Paenibacillus taichungensis]
MSPTVALSVDNHKLTKEIFREWSRENYGRPVGAKIEWTKMSPQQIQKLSEDMFNASKTPDSARREYYRTLNQFLYNLPSSGVTSRTQKMEFSNQIRDLIYR